MRFVVYGAGGVGGVVGGQLAEHGYAVTLIARGKHYEAIRRGGLRLETPDGVRQLDLPVVDQPARVEWTNDTVVLLAMKSQDTCAALDELAAGAPPDVPIACLQNGVANERMALRRFANVYGVLVYCAAGHLTPGVVQAWFAPVSGILDVGRYPSGVDPTATVIADAFRASTFFADTRADIMSWKYRKLLSNLANAVEALCGSAARGSAIITEARREAHECFNAAGIAVVSNEEDASVREKQLKLRPIDGRARPGGSTWQSFERGTQTIEADYLNGEIVLLGRMYGIRTPVNEGLQRLSKQAAREGKPPGSMSIEEFESLLLRISP